MMDIYYVKHMEGQKKTIYLFILSFDNTFWDFFIPISSIFLIIPKKQEFWLASKTTINSNDI